MKRSLCIALSSIHLLALAISTYIASITIQTILLTGWICSVTGIAAGSVAYRSSNRHLAFVSFLTPIVAIVLWILEGLILNLGPMRAAIPFSIVIVLNQLISTIWILAELGLLVEPGRNRVRQVTIRTLLASMVGFSVFFAVARNVLHREHNWRMALALGLLGITLVGLSIVLFSAFANRKKTEITH
jgi:hypothetical protein